MRFEIHRASGGQYYWRLVGENGEVLATSESYYGKQAARAGAEQVREAAGSAAIDDRT